MQSVAKRETLANQDYWMETVELERVSNHRSLENGSLEINGWAVSNHTHASKKQKGFKEQTHRDYSNNRTWKGKKKNRVHKIEARVFKGKKHRGTKEVKGEGRTKANIYCTNQIVRAINVKHRTKCNIKEKWTIT